MVVVVEVEGRASGRDESRGNRSDDRRSPERVRGAIEQLPHPSGVSNLTIMIYLTQASTTNILIHFGMRRRSPLRLRRCWIIVAVRCSLGPSRTCYALTVSSTCPRDNTTKTGEDVWSGMNYTHVFSWGKKRSLTLRKGRKIAFGDRFDGPLGRRSVMNIGSVRRSCKQVS